MPPSRNGHSKNLNFPTRISVTVEKLFKRVKVGTKNIVRNKRLFKKLAKKMPIWAKWV